METGSLHDYFGNFPHEVKLKPCEVRLKQALGNLKNLEKLKIAFGWRGSLLTIPYPTIILAAILDGSHYCVLPSMWGEIEMNIKTNIPAGVQGGAKC